MPIKSWTDYNGLADVYYRNNKFVKGKPYIKGIVEFLRFSKKPEFCFNYCHASSIKVSYFYLVLTRLTRHNS